MSEFLGNYGEMAVTIAKSCPYPYSYLAKNWSELSTWQTVTRGLVHKLLSYEPEPVPLDPQIMESFTSDGLIIERISYAAPHGPRTEAFFLRPADTSCKLPGVVALHDHGGFKYFGKEKLVKTPGEPPILDEFRSECYGGGAWAMRLAKRGYAVLVPDVFLWGSRRMDVNLVPEEFVTHLKELEPGSDAFIRAYNDFAGGYESVIAKSLFLAGTTWPGIMAYDDRRAVDYLVTRPEVDTGFIACGGLSGGGERTIFLSGLDSRIKAAFCVGFMSTWESTVRHSITWHTWMLHLPGLPNLLDMPDMISLHGNNPLMVLYDIDDPLWDISGQQAAHDKLEAIYKKMGQGGLYTGKFYPGPHKFDIGMQDDAFDWLDRLR